MSLAAFLVCQQGTESLLKEEIQQSHPAWRFAFSRPGLVTYHTDIDDPAQFADLQLKSIFARTYGCSLGRIQHAALTSIDQEPFRSLVGRKFDHLHVWIRGNPEWHLSQGPEAQATLDDVAEQLQRWAREQQLVDDLTPVNQHVRIGQSVLDCIIVDKDTWWLGWHEARCFGQRWPGGVTQLAVPDPMISRAYLKVSEALMWSRMPIKQGDACVEIGSAPGGACQALLERGLRVTGIDPSPMDERILAHPNFRHIQKRGADLKRREYAEFSWLIADSNVAPAHTLDTVEAIVTHPSTRFRGLLLTLKLLNPKLAQQLADDARRVRGWGFEDVRIHQLSHHRQEVCLAALRARSMRRRRPSRRRKN